MTKIDWIYDIESYPDIFTFCARQAGKTEGYRYEISKRLNQINEFMQFMYYLRDTPNNRMVGFNNVGYDYPVIHHLATNANMVQSGEHGAAIAYQATNDIITGDQQTKWQYSVWSDQRWVEQLDLYLIHHFNNRAKSTSLKMLEFQMRARNITDLPFPPGIPLNDPAKYDILLDYNGIDIDHTEDFYNETMEQIKFREELTIKYGRDCMNDNDTKIGKEYFISALERTTPGICYSHNGRKKTPNQTVRPHVALNDVILPYVSFAQPEFQRIKNWMKQQVLKANDLPTDSGYGLIKTKGVFEGVHAVVNGFSFHYGLGGIHGSINPCIVRETDDYCIVDIDVASYYPNLAIANRLYPAHLSEVFCDVYQEVFNERKQHAKKTPANEMLKLALNGVYGASGDKYSPFYDPQYMLAITINGQLLLSMLAEWVMALGDVTLLQINTDGLTVKLPRKQRDNLMSVCKMWEQMTGLTLEDVDYKAMYIRDVNAYIGEYQNGDLKLKGAYETAHPRDRRPLGWHQNTSHMVVPQAAVAALVYGEDIRTHIMNNRDPYDFMLRTKVPRSSKLYIGDTQVQNITRYFVSNNGGPMRKVMPPTPAQLKKDPNAPERNISINKAWLVTDCNCADDFDWANLNYNYYVQQAEDLVKPLLQGGVI